MATTSLWHIKGRLSDLIDYVENPEKTVPKWTEDFFKVFEYVRRPDKTTEQYVDTINCRKEIALQQMILTKRQYGKNDNYIAWHGYQSFKIGEVTPDIAHEIGMKLAQEMWGDRFQIVVTTHLDKDHIHNHFAMNSVSFRDGGKYNYSKKEQQRMRDVSDRLCLEYGLSVIRNPHKAPSRPVWLDEKSGKPTRYNVYRADVREAMDFSRTPYYMEDYLRRKGYVTDFTGKHWKLRLPQYEHFTRLDTLDPRWTPEYLEQNMGEKAVYGNNRPELSFSPHIPYSYSSITEHHERATHIYRLYVYYCFQLGIYPEGQDYKPTSPYLKVELRHLDELTAQVSYMEKNGIETLDDLYADRKETEEQYEKLKAQRTKLQNRIRRADPETQAVLREEKAGLTAQITELRKRLKCNYSIEERSVKIQENMERVIENENRFEKHYDRNERTKER